MKKEFVSYTMFAFSKDELKRLLLAAPTAADYIMLLLGSRYGFRREDIVNIKVSNVDLVNASITYYEKKKGRDRTIPIEPDVVSELRKYLGTIKKGQVNLLPFKDGTTAWRHLQEICSIAGIQVPAGRTGRPFHALRGTCVKIRQSNGWTIHEVARLIGDDPETVSQHYATVTTSELAEKMKRCV